MNRRTVLSAAGAVMFTPSAHSQERRKSDGRSDVESVDPVEWDEFIEAAGRESRPLFADRSQRGQDAYLHALAKHAARLSDIPKPNPRDFGGLEPGYKFDVLHRGGTTFIVLFWLLEPNAIFPAHCHPATNVCTVCLGGETLIRNYAPASDAPACWEERTEQFEIVETTVQRMTEGSINLVTEFRNNIHRFEAGPNGAFGIDITTAYGESKPFSYLRVGDSLSRPSGARTFVGQWVGKDIESAI